MTTPRRITETPITHATREMRVVTVPYSEAAMHGRIAGQRLPAVEEARYVNGNLIPPAERRGCRVFTADGHVPLLKSEAGWYAPDAHVAERCPA